MPIVKVELAD